MGRRTGRREKSRDVHLVPVVRTVGGTVLGRRPIVVHVVDGVSGMVSVGSLGIEPIGRYPRGAHADTDETSTRRMLSFRASLAVVIPSTVSPVVSRA